MWGRRSRTTASAGHAGRPDVRGRALGMRAARLTEIPNGTRVRIYGVARATDDLLMSPVGQRPCIAYRLVVDEPGWRQVLERTACSPFVAQDGEVLVRVRGPFNVLLQTRHRIDFDNDVQQRIAGLITEQRDGERRTPGRSIADEIRLQNYRYFEALIGSGDRVAIEGFASVTVDPAGERAALREPPLLYTLTGTAERPTIISVPEPGSVAP